MGIRILYDGKQNMASLYDSSASWSFGPVFDEVHILSADEVAKVFLKWWDSMVYPDIRLCIDSFVEQRTALFHHWLATFESGELQGKKVEDCCFPEAALMLALDKVFPGWDD